MTRVGSTFRTSIWVTALAVLGGIAASRFTARGHESPEHVIEMLTARMEATGPRADLLWRRAAEHRALGQLEAAEKDLRAAVRRQTGYVQAELDLSRVQLARGNTNGALKTIGRAARRTSAAGGNAEVLILHAEVLSAAGRSAEAIVECDRALKLDPVTNPEWYLVRCWFQYQLGRYRDAADGLRQGVRLTSNAVLEAEWIDALIDAGDFELGRQRVTEHLSQSRCQASWLIRRGRLNAGEGKITEAQADLLAAIKELNQRLAGARGDFTLLAERGLAYAVIGDLQQARTDLAGARRQGADHWILHRLERAVSEGNEHR
jgi:tetratricopeptide (TPR) repeat protein